MKKLIKVCRHIKIINSNWILVKKIWILIILIQSILFAIGTTAKIEDYFRIMGEVYFRFRIPQNISSLNQISRIISIEQIKDDWIYAYANEKEFKRFISSKIPYEVLEHPGYAFNIDLGLKFSFATVYAGQYPSYGEYIDMMEHFQSLYPDICRIYEIGTTVMGRKILCAKITGLADVFFKPRIFLTSTMHGNEPAGYVMMLCLIDYLLSEYGINPQITNIMDNHEIWINPLANPDGTYWAGDETVFGARRYNANSVDLNRNFPDPAEGNHPDGNQWQPETIAMMEFASNFRPVLSANFHSGAELVNYPWDTWERLHPDNDWFIFISRCYADTAQMNGPAGYFDDLDNGITNGYAWYRVTGSRQDYMNYFQHCREVTVEVSHEFLPQNPFLYWTYNRQAILDFISQSSTGICGIVLCQDGEPLLAKIEIPERDYDNSFVFTETQTGSFFRLLLPGRYNLEITAPYHYKQTLENIYVNEGELTGVFINLEHAAKGDPIADGTVDISDVIMCLRMVIGLDLQDPRSCDMNDDNLVDISDVILILRTSIGL